MNTKKAERSTTYLVEGFRTQDQHWNVEAFEKTEYLARLMLDHYETVLKKGLINGVERFRIVKQTVTKRILRRAKFTPRKL